jgi:hypothetical protein
VKRGREAFWHDVALGGVVAIAVGFAFYLLAHS